MKKLLNKLTKTYSKRLCTTAILLFIIFAIVGIVFSATGITLEIFSYIIPAAGTLASISSGFYYNKAKAENLSKQKIRDSLLKTALEKKVPYDTYQELCSEIDEIDNAVDGKLDEMLQEAIQTETDTNM